MENLNSDLDEIQAKILEKKNSEVSTEVSTNTNLKIDFNTKKDILPVESSEAEKTSSKAGSLVASLFEEAVLHTVSTDDEVKKEILDTAKQAVKDKTEAIKNQTDKESKEAYFDNNNDACKYFGYDEKTTSKFHVKLMAFWSAILNTLYICTFGFLIVSPLTFLCKKVKVIIKQTWAAFLLALFIYLLVIMSPVIVKWVSSIV